MKEKVQQAILKMRENPWEKKNTTTRCPLMCWDVTSMFMKIKEDTEKRGCIKK